ncbi:MAG: hypothetical protein Q8S06_04470 [Methanobacteriaceae archaeon]|nr:hypothetical protein [Methanobacteriaceae archaeon]
MGIKSTIPFPELKSTGYYSDVVIQYYDNKSPYDDKNLDFRSKFRSRLNIPILWDGQLIFRVLNGKEILISHDLHISAIFLRMMILSQGMAVILQQRGYLLLHASAVNVNDNAIAFLGEVGHGKSTITVALNERGYPLISDDILAIKLERNSNPITFPSFSRIKLNMDVIKHLNYSSNVFTKVHPDFEKYYFPIQKGFSNDSVPLKIIYVLNKSGKNEIQSLSSQYKLINLIKNTYTQDIFDSDEKASNLLQCADLIKDIKIKHLNVFHSLEKLQELVKILEEDFLRSI